MKRRSNMPPQRFEGSNGRMYAIEQQAFLELFIVPSSRENELFGDTAVITICGPLEQHDRGWCDSYEAIRARVAEACESSARAIVLNMESPGGDVAGCFESATKIREMCAAARKPLYAYCEKACSAGYALASAASFIVMSETSTVGSIGVLQTRPDYTAMNARDGLRIEFISSGTRKTYGNPDTPITDDELKSSQEIVDYVAGVFFALVETTRGIKATDVAAMQAGVFHAAAAKERRLVDDVCSFESLLARIASGKGLVSMGTAYEDAREKLVEGAKGEDANAAACKRALAALDEGKEDSDEETKDDETVESDDDDKTAESADDDKKAESDDSSSGDDTGKPKKVAESADDKKEATTHSIALQALAKAHTLEAKMAENTERDERKRLLAKRKDFDAELRSELMKASTPIATVRSLVKTLPRKPVAKPAAVASTTGTRGVTQGTPDAAGSDPRAAQQAELDVAMGITQQTFGVARKGNAVLFGVIDKPAAAAPSGSGGAK